MGKLCYLITLPSYKSNADTSLLSQFCSVILKYNPDNSSSQHLDIASSFELASSCLVFDEVSLSYPSNVKSSSKFGHKVQCWFLPSRTLLLPSLQTNITGMTADIPLVDLFLTIVNCFFLYL